MTFFRKAGIFFLSFVFCALISMALLSQGLVSFTNQQTLEGFVADIAESRLSTDDGENFSEAYDNLIKQCDSGQIQNIEIPIEDNEPVAITCEEIQNTSADKFNALVSKKMFANIYTQEYDCEFVDCLKQGRYGVLLSQKANDSLNNISLYLAGLAVLFGVAIFFVSSPWFDALKTIGSSFVLVGVPILFYKPLFNVIANKESTEGMIEVVAVLDAIFIPLKELAIAMVFLGVVAIGIYFFLSRSKNARK